ncbi:MAG: NAD(P)(+) transhydrogenase (Re/Si-specific) subunit beta, partial [Propionicimonas sp.]|nr:NAD(P)(+) transhydrogenase (Re/Si-specific) subunit beta [Propionicimonas sp.]
MLLHFIQGLYIVAGVLFILSLAGLSKQTTARLGNLAGMIGMVLALAATIIHSVNLSATEPNRLSPAITLLLIVVVLAIGAAIGTPIARKVEMTQMPQLIAAFHSFVGMAAVLVGFNSFAAPEAAGDTVHLVEVALGVLIGAYTFTGSVVAYLKLSAKMKSKPLTLPGRNLINLIGFLIFFALMIWFVIASEHNNALGWALIIAIAV